MLRGLHRARGRSALPSWSSERGREQRLVEFALAAARRRPGGREPAGDRRPGARFHGRRRRRAAGVHPLARSRAPTNEAVEVDAGIAEETDDVVRIMTMHGSKGLEFPIVVLANLGGQAAVPVGAGARRAGLAAPLPGRGQTAGAPASSRRPATRTGVISRSRALTAEQLRLLYVAATRARDHLIVPDVLGKRPNSGALLATLGPLLPDGRRGRA